MKLIILGLDALNHQIIEKCKEEMPILYNHLKNSVQGVLKTTIPYFTGATWTSFQTGKTVGNHGIINFFKYDPELNIRVITGKDIHEKTVYELIDENNLKCFVMNLPYSHPPKIKGDIIFSWMHIYNKIEDLFWPPILLRKYPSFQQYKNRADRSRSIIRYLKTTYEVLISQEKAIKEIISAKDHDVYFILINAADMVQHKTFNELMNGKKNRKTKLSLKILNRLDLLVGWIDKNKNEDTKVFIASDHGFQTYEGKFFVNSWLKKQGYLTISNKGKQIREVINRRQKKRGDIDISRIISFVKKYPFLLKISEPFYDFFVKYCPFDIIKQQGIDLEKTKAYCRSTFEGIIFFNKNIFGQEKRILKKEILTKLNEIPNITAHDCDEFYAGKYRTELGEILVTSKKYEMDSTICNQKFISSPRDMHSLEGIFMAYGKDIKEKKQVVNANIYDVAPTILYSIGIPVPKDMDGKILKDIFIEGTNLQKEEVKFSENDKTEEEKARIRQALKKIKI